MITLFSNSPTLDLHGESSDYARFAINDFINDNYKLKNEYIVIIHGKGSGILKKTTQEVLRSNKLVEEYKIDNFNDGQTVVKLRIWIWLLSFFMVE